MKRRVQLTPKDFFRLIHRAADGKVGATEQAFLRAIRAAKQSIDQTELRAAIESGNVQRIESALHIAGKLAPVLRAGLERNLASVMASVRVASYVVIAARVKALRINPRDVRTFTVVDPGPVRYLRERSGTLIKDITEATRDNVRRILSRGTHRGLTIKDKADRIERIVGLTTKQGEWVEIRRAKMIAKEVDPVEMEAALRKFEAKLIRQRAETIARTETMKAANEAHHESIKAKITKGQLDAQVVRLTWSVTPDDRLCPICEAIPGMNKDGISATGNDSFNTPIGPVDLPPAHPQCRCVVLTEIVTANADWERAIEAVHGRRAA